MRPSVLPEHQCLLDLALRQSLLRLAGLDWRVPDFNTISRRRRRCRCNFLTSAAPQHLDSLVWTVRASKFLGRGGSAEEQTEYQRQWRKVHLGIDAHTLKIRAIEITNNSMSDTPCRPNCWPRH